MQVPDDYTNFQPNYNEENEQQEAFWNLHWDSGAPGGGGIDAMVNATTGELWGLSQYQPAQPATGSRGQPELSRDDALAAAASWLQKVLPNYYGHLWHDPVSDQCPDLGLRQGTSFSYAFTFIRTENGIPFPENSATIQIDAGSGAVTSFQFIWDQNLKFPAYPDPTAMVPYGQVVSLWKTNAEIGLEYFLPPTFAPKIGGASGSGTARLLYVPKNAGIMIDAVTGEALKPESGLFGGGGGGVTAGAAKMPQAASVHAPLTPAEQTALAEMGKPISRDKALAIVKNLVVVPSGYQLQDSNLYQDYLGNRQVWSFSWQQASMNAQGYQNSLSADVDAGSGQLIGFSLNAPAPDQQAAPTLDEDQARDLAGGFLNKVAGAYLQQLDSLQTSPAPPIIPPASVASKPVSFTFTADRLVNGIPFDANGVSITVDAVRGMITSYRLNWWKMEFPGTQGVIGQDGAEEAFLGSRGLGLEYMWQTLASPGQDPASLPVRLVYALSQAPAYVDPFTGLALGDDFQPQLNPNWQAFDDLAGQPEAEAVNLLADSRIIPVYGADFQPQARLSCGDWLIWLVRADNWRQASTGDPDQDYDQAYQQALALGILKPGEQYQPQADLDQATMAKMAVRALGWDEIAQFQGIWSQPAGGAGKVTEADLGYLSLAQGLGIIDLNDKDFDPAVGLTRAEGALILYKLCS